MNKNIEKLIRFVGPMGMFAAWFSVLWFVSSIMDLDASMGFEYNVMNVLIGYGLILVVAVSLIFLILFCWFLEKQYEKIKNL